MRKIAILLGALLSIPAAHALNLTSTDFGNHDRIPTVHTCDAQDISPELSWSNAPAKTKSYTLVISDPDAPSGTWYHWVVFNIPKYMHKFRQSVALKKSQGIIGTNSYQQQKYIGPCPPMGESHRYIFDLYAVDRSINLDATADAVTVLNAIKPHVLAKATLVASYKRKAAP